MGVVGMVSGCVEGNSLWGEKVGDKIWLSTGWVVIRRVGSCENLYEVVVRSMSCCENGDWS